MPASITAIMKNVERMAGDDELLALWQHEVQAKDGDQERSVGQAWRAFIEAADAARIADRIPGSVGRAYKVQYATEVAAAPVKRATRKPSPKGAGK